MKSLGIISRLPLHSLYPFFWDLTRSSRAVNRVFSMKKDEHDTSLSRPVNDFRNFETQFFITMKAVILTTLFFAFAISAAAQWNTSGSNIYNSNSGNVGIGTSTPSQFVTVFAQADADVGIWTNNSSNKASLWFRNHALGYDAGIMYRGDGRLSFNLDNSGSGVETNEYMTISPNGNIGVGSASPSAKLHILSTTAREAFRVYQSGVTSTYYLSAWQGSVAAVIDPIGSGKLFLGYDQATDVYIGGNSYGGKLGIGTSVPGGQLHLASGSSHSFKMTRANGLYGFQIVRDASAGIIHFQNTDDYNNFGTRIRIDEGGTGWQNLILNPDGGNVCVGCVDPKGYKLAIAGKIVAEELDVKLQVNWPDYVFFDEYKLPSLLEVERYIKANKHLPDVPSAAEVKENGLSLGEMNAILLKKVEELTLHLIEIEKQNRIQQKEIEELKRNQK
jgi:hypothetical protein